MDSDEEQSVQESMDGEEWKELHQGIQNGDVEYVRRLLQNEADDQHFSYERTSALCRALSCKEYEIATYLIHRGAKIPDSEVDDLDSLDLKRLNHLLLQYNRKTEKSCIYQFVSWSQSPQGLEGDRLRAVISLYEEFYESPILRLIMMVLEKKQFEIIFDFKSDYVNRIHRFYEEEAEIYGLALTDEREIFVGAKNMLSGDSRKRAKVCGVVAEEFCHLALAILFDNEAKPYREEESELKSEFRDIVEGVRSSLNESCHVESVIKDVYKNYGSRDWECELIARVPHVIGIYGEEKGRITMESRELSRLFSFYVDNVHPKCKVFTDPTLNTKAHRQIEQLSSKNNFISYQEKQAQPLKNGFPSFRESLVDVEGVSVITTNSVKICTLQIYHELKREFGDVLEKKCIFVSRERFEEKKKKILNALRSRAWRYLILVLDEEDLNLRSLTCKYLDEFEEFKGDEIKIVIISVLQFLGPKFEDNRVRYKWNDLTDEFKALQEKIRYLFRGEEESVYIAKEKFQELFNEEEILRIISGTVFRVLDGEGLDSHDYSPETYIERKFEIMTLDKEFFKHIPSDTSVFLSGFSMFDFAELQIHSNVVQWISGPGVEIQKGKSIFIDDIYTPITFKEFVRRNSGVKNIWAQYDRNTFYLRCSEPSPDVSKRYVIPITLQEKEMLEFLKKNHIVIISDNAGYGKSTVTSNLIRITKEIFHHSWVWRIDFNKFVMPAKDRTGNKNPLSLGNINTNSDEEDVLGYFFLVLGFDTGLEKYIFKDLSRYGECFVFFDGFDEIPSEYEDCALKLLSIVSEKTNAKMIVTTRKHREKQLEELLNRISHQLEPFSREDQVKFLDKFWKYKLRPQNVEKELFKKSQKAVAEKMIKLIEEQKGGKTESDSVFGNMEHALEKIQSADSFDSVKSAIESLDFAKLAERMLGKTLRDGGNVEFMAIPLHLNMIANIYYNGNFNIETEYDIYHLYQQFIEQKILIYIEEKEGFLKEGKLKDRIVKSNSENAYRIHEELALRWTVGQERDQLDGDDWELCSALGIVCIQSGRCYFIHKTFAEFFLSELTRKEVEKEVFLKILSGFEYNTVRRFLSSALREKDYENYQSFKDSNFLTDVMDQTLKYSAFYVVYESNCEMFSTCKIAKKLLQNFEAADDTKNLVHEFIDRFHEHVMSKSKRKFEYCNSIGGCITAYMLQRLLSKDLSFYCRSITIFVRVSENVEEVLDVLNACIIINKDLRCSADIRDEGNEQEDAVADSLLDILAHKIAPFLLLHALSNERSEVFAHILKLFKDVLGRERFISEIVENEEYTNQVMLYLSNVSLNRFCSTFEALHSIFGNELENLFIKDIKVWIIFRAAEMDGSRASTKSLERVISSFLKCFGIKKLKEFLLSGDFKDDYLINTAIRWFASSIFMDYFRAFERNLDEEEMKQFLRSRKEGSKNVFHWVHVRDLYLKDLLQFFKGRLEEDEIKEMLSDSDANGDNLMHMIFRFNSLDKMKDNLVKIKQHLSDDGLFYNLLKSRNSELFNFYNFSALNKNELDFSFLTHYLSTSEMTELLLQRDAGRATFLHHAACYNVEKLPFFLEYAHRMFNSDGSRFRKLVFMRTKDGNTFLHVLQSLSFGWHPNVFHLVFDTLRQTLPHEIFRRLLKLKNKNGQTFLQTERRDEIEIKTVFKKVLEADLFEEVLEKRLYNPSNVYISALLHGIAIACSIYDKLTNSNACLDP